VEPGHNPQQRWQARVPLEKEERERLKALVNRLQAEEKANKKADTKAGAAGQETDVTDRSCRVVLRGALGALGYLILRWRRIYPRV
jgi:ferric-dicitrate binding protein FerR (iron transport regulator)